MSLPVFFQEWLSPLGRRKRLLFILINIGCNGLMKLLNSLDSKELNAPASYFTIMFGVFSMTGILLLLWTLIVNNVKRLRDVGWNPWLSVLFLLLAVPRGLLENGVTWALFILSLLCALPLIFIPSKAKELSDEKARP